MKYVVPTLVVAASILSVLGGFYALGTFGVSSDSVKWQWPEDNLPTIEYVRDYTLHYLRDAKNMKTLPDPLTTTWTSSDETPKDIVGYTTIQYSTTGTTVTIGYPIVAPDNLAYEIVVESDGLIVWHGQLFQGQFEALLTR